jgi:hypothetical protein
MTRIQMAKRNYYDEVSSSPRQKGFHLNGFGRYCGRVSVIPINGTIR